MTTLLSVRREAEFSAILGHQSFKSLERYYFPECDVDGFGPRLYPENLLSFVCQISIQSNRCHRGSHVVDPSYCLYMHYRAPVYASQKRDAHAAEHGNTDTHVVLRLAAGDIPARDSLASVLGGPTRTGLKARSSLSEAQFPVTAAFSAHLATPHRQNVGDPTLQHHTRAIG